jgi:flagellar basal body-associated protein FliL
MPRDQYRRVSGADIERGDDSAMHGVIFIAIVFGGVVLALAIVGSTILMGIRLLKGGISPGDRRSESEEARVIQEIYNGLGKMEKRMEALETIIIESERKDRPR